MSLNELFAAISAWVGSVRPEADVRWLSPGDPATEGVAVRVLGLRPVNDNRGTLARRDPIVDVLEVELLLSIEGGEPAANAALAADLQFASLETALPFHLDLASSAGERARMLGLAPMLGMVLRARITRERPAKPVKLVREAHFDLVDRARAGASLPEPEPAPGSGDADTPADGRRTRRRNRG